MCQHLRRRHLAPASLTLRLQFSQPGLYLIRHRRIEQVLHPQMPPLNENNQKPVSEGSFFYSLPIEYPLGAVSQTTSFGTPFGVAGEKSLRLIGSAPARESWVVESSRSPEQLR